MKSLFLVALLLLATCSSHQPPKLSAPPDDAPTGEMNIDHWPGMNDLVQPPLRGF